MMTSYAQKFTTKPRLHKIIHIIWTYNTVRTWVFFTSLFLWDSAHAKICKFDFRIRGLVVKSARQTSSRIGAIHCEPLHTVLRDEDKCGVGGGRARAYISCCAPRLIYRQRLACGSTWQISKWIYRSYYKDL